MSNNDLFNEHIVIDGWMRSVLELKGNELLVFALIYGFSQDGDSCFYGRRSYLQKWLGVSLPTIDGAINNLLDKNLIIKETNTINGMVYNKYKVNLETVEGVVKNFIGCKEILYPHQKILHIDNKYNSSNNNINNNNIYINNNININNKYIDILEYWNSKNIIKHKESKELFTVIEKAIKIYGVEEIKKCIDRYHTILNDGNYFFNYKWTLKEFLKQKNAISSFSDEGSKWNDYINRPKVTNNKKVVKEVPNWYNDYIEESLENKQQEEKKYSQQELEELFKFKK